VKDSANQTENSQSGGQMRAAIAGGGTSDGSGGGNGSHPERAWRV